MMLRVLLMGVLPVIAIAVAVGFYAAGGRYVGTDNAYLKADKASVAAEVSGPVSEILVQENQKVVAGQTLFRIDDRPYRIALDRAEAELRRTANDVASLRASYQAKREEIHMAETNAAYFDRESQRQTELVSRNIAAPVKADEARNAADSARQKIAVLRQNLAEIVANLGGEIDAPLETRAQYLAARAARDQAALDLARTVVNAPGEGIVSRVDALRPGTYVRAGTPVFSIVAADHVWIEANFKETDLTYMRPGQTVSVEVDSYPGRTWKGVVSSISQASGSEFSILPPQNASGNWVKVVQRIPVRILLDGTVNAQALRAGMSANVEVDTGHRRGLPGVVGTALAGSDSYILP